jgi:hypothetical protein
MATLRDGQQNTGQSLRSFGAPWTFAGPFADRGEAQKNQAAGVVRQRRVLQAI